MSKKTLLPVAKNAIDLADQLIEAVHGSNAIDCASTDSDACQSHPDGTASFTVITSAGRTFIVTVTQGEHMSSEVEDEEERDEAEFRRSCIDC